MASPGGNPPNHLRAFSSVDGHELWNDEIERSWSHVGIANDLLFVGTEETMQRCGVDLEQECSDDDPCPSGPCVEASPYYVYDARDGRRLTTLMMPANVAGGPSIVDGTAYVPYGTFDIDGGVVAFEVPACLGDCNRNGVVAINELVTGVNIALEAAPVTHCMALDSNRDGLVQINELVGGTRSVLEGCA